MIVPASASTLAIAFWLIVGAPLGRSTTGILAMAQPDAVVMSALVHTTALGAVPYFPNE